MVLLDFGFYGTPKDSMEINFNIRAFDLTDRNDAECRALVTCRRQC